MKTLIKNGAIVSGEGIVQNDILIEDGIIQELSQNLPKTGAQVYDVEGALVFPGFIDTHTHLDMNTGTALTVDDFTSGTRSAIKGGTTTILDFATQEKEQTLQEALRIWHLKADGKSACDYGFHMAITDYNTQVERELPSMTKQGVTSYKLYMAYDALRVSDAQIYHVLRAVAKEGGIVGMHCENGDLVNVLIENQLQQGHTSPAAHPLSRPNAVEAEAINRYLTIADMADCPVNIVHLSTRQGLELMLAARAQGQKVYIETCPQYLLLEESKYHLPGFESAKYVISPPLRQKEDIEALWDAISLEEIDTIGTDHCAFNYHGQKEMGKDNFSKIPNGAPGLENRVMLMETYGVQKHYLSHLQLCKLLCENPAKLFGMYPKKGAIQVGSDADIVVWDESYRGEIRNDNQLSACDYTPFDGFSVMGRPRYVFLRGQLAVSEGDVLPDLLGSYVSRGACQWFR